MSVSRLPSASLFLVLAVVSACPAADETQPAVRGATRPLEPDEALAHFQIEKGCRIELVACEPDVIDPVHIAFDAQGRLWVVEYSDYPNGPTPGQPGLSRIRVLTDDDGDGRYENAQVFADKLLFATGLLHWKDGVIVTTAGSVLYLRDTNGDGRADQTQEWFTGFKQENPQLRANHPTFGIDNHVYIASGLRGGEIVPGKDWDQAFAATGGRPRRQDGEPLSLSGRDFRFDPLTGEYEAVTGVGQFGLSFDDWGNRFVCSNRNPCKQIVFEERFLKKNPAVAVQQVFEDVLPAAENSRLYPISRTWTTSNLHANQFTAACGLCIYRGSALPGGMYGSAFVCEPTANLVHREMLEPKGATFTSHVGVEGSEFLATTDEWFRPVNLTIGPDGALYVVDMYRAVIEHPQFMPEELKNRPDLLLGTDRGRIYRVVANASATPPAVKCALPGVNPSTTGLADLIDNSNGWQRDTAQRMLFERQDTSAKERLKLVLMSGSLPQARGQSLRVMQGLGVVDAPLVETALADESPRVREQIVRMLGDQRSIFSAPRQSELSRLALTTDDSSLRFQTVMLFGGAVDPQGRMFADLAARYWDDDWLMTAIAVGAPDPGRIANELIRSLEELPTLPADHPRALEKAQKLQQIRRFTLLAAMQQDGQGADALLVEMHRSHELGTWTIEQEQATLRSILSGWQQIRRLDPNLERQMPEIRKDIEDLFQDAALRVFAQSQRAAVRDEPDAMALLEFAPWVHAQYLGSLIRSQASVEVRRQAIEILGRRSEPEARQLLIEAFNSLTPDLRNAALEALTRSPEGITLLLDEIEAERISPRFLDAARVKQLTSHRDRTIQARAKKLLASLTPADRQKVLAQYQECLTLKASPKEGRELFRKNCTTCHRIGDDGVNVAPDISDSRVKTADYLLTSILDPNRAIDNNYFSYTVIDTSGVALTGIVATETATSVTLKQPEGKTVTVLRSDIDEMKSNGISLMPEGLERNITPQQMADLISYIKNWCYLDGSVPPEVIR